MSTVDPSARFNQLNSVVAAEYEGLKSDLQELQRGGDKDQDWLLNQVETRINTISQARASFESWADKNDLDLEKLAHQAPLSTLGFEGPLDVSALTSGDIIALVAGLFKLSGDEQRQSIEENLKSQQSSSLAAVSVDQSTSVGANIAAGIEALDWAPEELQRLLGATANVGLGDGDSASAVNQARDLVGKLSYQQLANVALVASESSPLNTIDSVLQRLAESKRANTDSNVDEVSDARSEIARERIEAVVQALLKGVLSVSAVTAGITENMTLTEEQEADREVRQERELQEKILAAASGLFDSTEVDTSEQAVVSGPGAGRTDIELLKVVLEANWPQFSEVFQASQQQSSRLEALAQAWEEGVTLQEHSPNFI